jgi:rhamnose utilization protein RhaD (predicted bifunctional aldolase and dehydrogenase)
LWIGAFSTYGRNPAYVLAGWGNTSFKTYKELYVKASGIPLSDIQPVGFVAMSMDLLKINKPGIQVSFESCR